MTEPTEEVAVEIIPIPAEEAHSRALVAADRSAPLWEIGALDDAEYAQRKLMLVKGQERIADLQRSLLAENVDYGAIPGTGTRKVLLKPGAEKLAAFWRLVPTFTVRKSVTAPKPWGDPLTISSGPDRIDYEVRCQLHHGSQQGPVVGEGVGEASSYERKYRYREQKRTCPKCEQETIFRSREEYGGGWYCNQKAGGCGQNYKPGDQSIESQSVGLVDNDDPHDLGNTLAKMGAKRAFVDAVIRTLGASALFTQDEDAAGMAPAPERATETADTPRGGTQPRPAAGGRPAAPVKDGEVGTFEGEVVEMPDGTRMTPSGRVLRVKVKVGGRNHQVELWDQMADEILALVGKGSQVAVRGTLKLEAWQRDGKDMPPVRKIIDVTHIALRDEQGDWQAVQVGSHMPLADPPNRQPDPTPGGAASGPAAVPAASATAAETATTDSLPFDDDDPDWGMATLKAPPVMLPADYPLEHGEDGETYDGSIVVLSVADVTGAANPYLRLVVADPERRARYDVVMEHREAVAQGVDKLATGDLGRLVGTWWKSPTRGTYALMATAIEA